MNRFVLRLLSAIWMSHINHVTHANASYQTCHTRSWVRSHAYITCFALRLLSAMWMRHIERVTRANVSYQICHTYDWVMSHVYKTCFALLLLSAARCFQMHHCYVSCEWLRNFHIRYAYVYNHVYMHTYIYA